ncbi:MAG TPA: twin-arginine translocase subunit TatC [Lentimicrobium sp.]|jgi:sec-independent protein translocase protein TatC|nr:twin-arginine translocase subunit TatC [Lentimicrobium sp.]
MAETVTSKKKKKKEEPAEMSFLSHLDALRGTLFRSAIAVLILSVVAFMNRKLIFDEIILAPKESSFITYKLLCQLGQLLHTPSLCLGNYEINIINLNLSGQFYSHMTISFYAGIILAAPYVLWEFWRFIKPAMYDNEKKHSKGAVTIMSLLFILGVLFSYYVLVPITLNFFGTYSISDQIANQISLSSYISTFTSVTLSVGVVFELPVLIYFLTKIGIVTPEFLRRIRKYMIIIILTIAAIVTPPDVFSQILVSIPLLALYEISIIVSSRIEKKQLSEEL